MAKEHLQALGCLVLGHPQEQGSQLELSPMGGRRNEDFPLLRMGMSWWCWRSLRWGTPSQNHRMVWAGRDL